MNRSVLGLVLLGGPPLACNKEIPPFPATSQASTSGDDATTGIPVDSSSAGDPTTGGLDIDGTSSSGAASTTTGEPGSSGEPGGSSESSGSPTPPTCGNGRIDASEDCDGDDLAGATCAGLDPDFTGGMLACSEACTWDSAGCTRCGNGSLDPGEACDGTNLDGADCSDLGYLGGSLGCAACSYDESGCSNSGSLFFSEYVEGSASNKALEIHNPTAAAVDLGACEVRIYFNGSAMPGTSISLAGSLAPDAVHVICDDGIASPGMCDVLSNASFHSGNDAVALACGGVMVDVIGQIGVDPGAEWVMNGVGTGEETLRRSCSVSVGDANGADAFDPSLEWVSFPQNTLVDLGQYVCP